MAISITATAGSASANSFVTEAEFIAYCAETTSTRLHASATTSGSTATESEKAALVEATRELDRLTWAGTKVTTTQRLAAPRAYWPDPDPPEDLDPVAIEDEYFLDATTIPRRLKEATCELAIQYLRAGSTDFTMPAASEGVKRKRVDVLETEYFAPGVKPSRGVAQYPAVWSLVAPLLATGGSGLRVVRV